MTRNCICWSSIQRIHGTTHLLEQLDPVTPAGFGPGASLIRSSGHQLVQGLIVMSLIDREASPQETDLVEQFAQALEVSVPELTDSAVSPEGRNHTASPRSGAPILAEAQSRRDLGE